MTSITAELATLLSTVHRPGDFFTAGTTALLAPMLEVDGVGPVALPLLPSQAEKLVAVAEQAPYGRGEATIIDPAVRRCWQIGADRVHISGRHWAETLKAIVERVGEGLGVSEPITAEFYKLLVYDQGSFFVGHRDTEKSPGMFATLLIVLPSRFAGGELVVRHKGREVRLDMRADEPAEAAFAAFYADCVHEVRPVTQGCRLVLAYNLSRSGRAPKPPDYTAQQELATALLQAWRAGTSTATDDQPVKLVYPLEHAYTPAELGFPRLKGADAAAAGVLTVAALRSQCDVHLALLTIEESGAAEYSGYYGSGRGHWREEKDEFEAGEVFDRSVTLSDWRRPDDDPCVLGEIPVEDQEISPPDACAELTPDEEHFHEATGNEGASFERTYQRAALVLWPSDRIFAVLSQAGLAVTLPYLDDLIRRWAESGAERSSPLWDEAHNLAGHMLAQWPTRRWYPHSDATPSEAGQMLALLTRLDDRETIQTFLTDIIAAGYYVTSDNAAIIGALDRSPPSLAAALMERIIIGSAETAFGACADLLRRAAEAWISDRPARLNGAATRLVEALPGALSRDDADSEWEAREEVDDSVVVDLLSGLGAIDLALAGQVVDRLLAWPKANALDAIFVPALRRLVASGAAQGEALERLRSACLVHLRTRVAEPLVPPADWRRDSTLSCNCERCNQLARFLADPAAKAWVFKAAESNRSHVADTIKRARSDVDVTTSRQGRPYGLVCTKNRASYERRARQRTQDLDDLERLAG